MVYAMETVDCGIDYDDFRLPNRTIEHIRNSTFGTSDCIWSNGLYTDIDNTWGSDGARAFQLWKEHLKQNVPKRGITICYQ